jgi:hypothetical protein
VLTLTTYADFMPDKEAENPLPEPVADPPSVRQRLVGVVENMSGLLMPDGSTMRVFGEGGGTVAERPSRAVGADVPLLGQVPLDPALVLAGDSGVPLVLSAPDSAVGKELRSIADALSTRKRGLAWHVARPRSRAARR